MRKTFLNFSIFDSQVETETIGGVKNVQRAPKLLADTSKTPSKSNAVYYSPNIHWSSPTSTQAFHRQ